MTIELGRSPLILIIFTLFESLFIIIPNLISSKIEKRTFKEEIMALGFKNNNDTFTKLSLKYLIGIFFGILFFLTSGYILFFFKDILVQNLFSKDFVDKGSENMIITNPINPNLFELIIIILLQLFIVGPCEEGFFRGFILKKSNRKMHLALATTFSSICFAFYHVPPFIVPLPTIITFFGYYLLIGILLSSIYILFDFSLIPSIATHSVFNILI
ncbi:MAG: CPBP family intramembrane glutamic endopeptidase, partial [Candidatus Heimdallarchaeota archaeon]